MTTYRIQERDHMTKTLVLKKNGGKKQAFMDDLVGSRVGSWVGELKMTIQDLKMDNSNTV